MESYIFRTILPFDGRAVYRWHLNENVFERCFPQTEVIQVTGKKRLRNKCMVWSFRLRELIFKHQWQVECSPVIEDSSLKMTIKNSPAREFQIAISIWSAGPDSCELIEEVQLDPGYPPWARPIKRRLFKRRLKKFFQYKHELIKHDLCLFSKYPIGDPLKILIVGATGLIGSATSTFLKCAGHEVWKLVRKKRNLASNEIRWDPEKGQVNWKELEGFDAVINLAGYGVGEKRWTPEVKREIFDSRISTTEKLLKLLVSLKSPPRIFLCASAVGYYGDHRSEMVDEGSVSQPVGFLPRVCREWEAASGQIHIEGMRVVNMRFGLVLSGRKGALKKAALPFKWGVGAILGSGDQYMSWVALDDAVAAIYHCLMRDSIKGAVNIVAPESITNASFSQALAYQFKSTPGLRLSTRVISWVLGEMGEELFLTSVRALPSVLNETGFSFRYPQIEQALKHLL